MTDPFSIAVGAVGLIGALGATGKAAKKLLKLRKAPHELMQLYNEVSNSITLVHDRNQQLILQAL